MTKHEIALDMARIDGHDTGVAEMVALLLKNVPAEFDLKCGTTKLAKAVVSMALPADWILKFDVGAKAFAAIMVDVKAPLRPFLVKLEKRSGMVVDDEWSEKAIAEIRSFAANFLLSGGDSVTRTTVDVSRALVSKPEAEVEAFYAKRNQDVRWID